MNVRVRTYDEKRERNVATFDEVQFVVIKTAGGTFRLKEADGVLQLATHDGRLVVHPWASNLVKLTEETP